MAAGLLVLATVGPVRSDASQGPEFAIEARYAGAGPNAVATMAVPEDGPARFEVFYPADIGTSGDLHPVIVWGNGSDASPADYEALLRHLASWGMVVVAATTSSAGDGNEILAAADHAVAANADPASQLHGHLDTAAIGAAGHSQGAGGAVRASTRSDGLIVTTVPLSLPARLWVTPGRNHEYAPGQLTGSVLFLSGSTDIIISGPQVNRAYFNEAPAPAAMAMRRGAGHLEPTGDGDGFRGYLTAWFRYQLMGDADAAMAFAGDSPELLHNPGWERQAVKGMTVPDADPSPTPAPDATTSPAPPGEHVDETAPPTSDTEPLPATGGHRSWPFALAAAAVGAVIVARLAARRL